MTTEHTPWHASTTKNGAAYDIGGADGSNIALVHGPQDGGPDNFRDIAHLVVASPDMLTALLPFTFCDENTPPPGVFIEHWNPAVEAARKARAKAEGR